MEIHNHGNDHRLHFRGNESARKPSQAGSESTVQPTDQVEPSRLVERLQGDAEVRERLLVEIQARVLAGEYMTRAAAEQAAQQIVE